MVLYLLCSLIDLWFHEDFLSKAKKRFREVIKGQFGAQLLLAKAINAKLLSVYD